MLEASRDKLARAILRSCGYAKKLKDFNKLAIDMIGVPALGALVGSASGVRGKT